jgi:hypothetical protein
MFQRLPGSGQWSLFVESFCNFSTYGLTLYRNCHFHPNVDTVATELRALSLTQPHPAMDLEDIVKEGQKGKACPYYLSRRSVIVYATGL